MPRNRRPRDREEKRDEILVAAAGLFIEGGYDETSLAKVAAAADVTTTTIYWYFSDKDALLVAVLDRLLEQALADAAGLRSQPWADQLLWSLERLEQFKRLVTVVHARSATSPAVDTWHTGFHALMDSFMAAGFRRTGVPEDHLLPMTQIGAFVIEGLLMHGQSEAERRAVIQTLASPRFV